MTGRRQSTSHLSIVGTASMVALLSTSVGLADSSSRVSVNSNERQGDSFSAFPAVSGDGRFVAFWSLSGNLVAGDSNDAGDVFVHDRESGETAIVSLSTTGQPGNGESALPSLSEDGRFVAFKSAATNLVRGDSNSAGDVFVRDRTRNTTVRVSISNAGSQGNAGSSDDDAPAISGDGRYVAFSSNADNLVANDNNGVTDIFAYDRQRGVIRRVSVASDGTEANGRSTYPAISGDGRFVAFRSEASSLVARDTNAQADIFVHDLASGTTKRVSINSTGGQSNGASSRPTLNSDGRYVAFWSAAANLVADDFNGRNDAFVHDLQSGETSRVSLDGNGQEGDGDSTSPSISGDGRLVAFRSDASNLVANDRNGFNDIFLRDRKHGSTVRVSLGLNGSESGGVSFEPAISADSRYIAFASSASNLVPGDTNRVWDVFSYDRAEPLAVDFKPNDPWNWVAPMSDGYVGVMLKSTQLAQNEVADLDAPQIDPMTVRVGPGQATASARPSRIQDFDRDGDRDLIVPIFVPQLQLACDDKQIDVIAETFEGKLQVGSDQMAAVGCNEKTVEMDFKPNDPLNRVTLKVNGLFGVSLMATSRSMGDRVNFNPGYVDLASVELGPNKAKPRPKTMLRDLDGDGDEELVLRFKVLDLGLSCNDASVEIRGMTVQGAPFRAEAAIRTSRC